MSAFVPAAASAQNLTDRYRRTPRGRLAFRISRQVVAPRGIARAKPPSRNQTKRHASSPYVDLVATAKETWLKRGFDRGDHTHVTHYRCGKAKGAWLTASADVYLKSFYIKVVMNF